MSTQSLLAPGRQAKRHGREWGNRMGVTTSMLRPRDRRPADGDLAPHELLVIYTDLLRQGHPICKRMSEVVNEVVESFEEAR